MHPYLNQVKPHYDGTIDQLQKELSGLRTGRATPALVEDVKVRAYDADMDLKGVASITIQDSKTLLIEPWDKSLIQAIEKAIRDADLGISPAVDGQVVRISLPQMTEENRKQLVKHMKERLEEARVRLRGAREDARDEVAKMEKSKEIGEDEKFKIFDEIDKMTKEYNEKIEGVGDKKEEEIMTV